MTDSAWFIWVVLPLLIFLARITDVSLGTMRILFVVRGARRIAALLGFTEVFIWVVVINQIMGDHTGMFHYVAYAAGFAAGNAVGITIETRLALGLQTIRVITSEPTQSLEKDMLAQGFGATRMSAMGLRGGAMTILFSTLSRRKIPVVMRLIEQHLPKAFISVEDVKTIREGQLPLREDSAFRMRLQPFGRKGK